MQSIAAGAPALTHPAPFGQWLLRGGQLTCRLPDRQLALRAPARLLQALAERCDGQTALEELVAGLASDWDAQQVRALLQALGQAGALVDAGTLLAHWTRATQQPRWLRGSGKQARTSATTLRMPQPSAWSAPAGPEALSALLAARRSERTFDDRPITAQALDSLLWAANGWTGDQTADGQARRTCASGGATYPLRWFVAVLRDLPGQTGPALAAGLYAAQTEAPGGDPAHGIRLHRLQAPGDVAWQWLGDPRALRFASALLVPIADMALGSPVYGNRAPLLAQLEAGAALQNMQLMAAALGLAGCLRGDLAAPGILPSLELDPGHPWMPLAGYLVGQAPTAAQRQAQATEHWLHLTHAPHQAAGTARHAYAAGPVRGAGVSTWALGRAAQAGLAVDKAEAEAWERRAWLTPGALVFAPGQDLAGALDPSVYVAYSPAQRRRQGFPFAAYDPQRVWPWQACTDVHTGQQCHLPADCIHPWTALALQARPHTAASTSGVAAWPDANGALARAVLELIERDAVLRAWLARHAPDQVAIASLPPELQQRVRALEDTGHRVVLLALPCPWSCAAAVFLQHRSRPFTGLTSAASFDWISALDKALDEAEGRAAWAACAPPRDVRASAIQGPDDVHAWWCTAHAWHRADFLAASTVQRTLGTLPVPTSGWPALLHALADAGHRILSVDLTPPQASIHQGRQPLSVVRAVVSGLLPIWFRPGEEPAGLPAFRQALGTAQRPPAAIHPLS